MKAVAVVLAGGSGSRMKGYGKPKQFLPLGKRSILGHSLKVFRDSKKVGGALVTLPKEHWDEACALVKREGFEEFVTFVEGGPTRQASVWNALKRLQEHSAPDLVLIHDSARPFISPDLIVRSLGLALEHGAVEVAVPTVDTIVENEGQTVSRVLDRSRLYSVQTPQTFQFPLIWKAHQEALATNITNASDDAQLVLRLGHPVRILEGSPDNFKITTPRDYEYARSIQQT